MGAFVAVKNSKQTVGSMRGTLIYILDIRKTMYENQRLCTGVNCNLPSALTEMMLTKKAYGKADGRMFYQFVQSFPSDTALTPPEVHALGIEFAQKQFPQYEVVVTTHLNTANMHSHIFVNSVNYETGKKLHQNHDNLVEHRKANDELCLKFGESPLPNYQKGKRTQTMSNGEYRSAMKGQSWKMQLMNTIDDCMRFAKSKEDFIGLMQSEGYDIRWTDTRQNITYTTPNGMKCRDNKLHEEKYLKQRMEEEFAIRKEIILGGTQGAQQTTGSDDTAIADIRARDTAPTGNYNPEIAVSEQGAVQLSGVAETDIVAAKRDAEQLFVSGADEEIRYDDTRIAKLEQDALTGWEEERMALISAEVQTSTSEIRCGNTVSVMGSSSISNSLLRLGASVEFVINGDDAPMPLAKHHIDKKRYKRLMQKKIAQGHKEDDQGAHDFDIKPM